MCLESESIKRTLSRCFFLTKEKKIIIKCCQEITIAKATQWVQRFYEGLCTLIIFLSLIAFMPNNLENNIS